jgi:RNA polymerase sigma-70 factor, ECF subfamily
MTAVLQRMNGDVTRSLDLVRKAQHGDREALNRLFARYYERVRRIVRLRLGRRLRENVDSGDILQETFAAAVRAFEGFEVRDEASLIHWLSRLAERQIIAQADYFSARKRDQRRNVALEGTAGDGSSDSFRIEHADDSTRPLDRLADAEESVLVESCIAELSEDYRELILLRNYAGASWEAVAEETGRPSAAAARMMHARAMVELGKLVRQAGIR